jgi:hypothetical protein
MFCKELRSKKLALLRRLPLHAAECLDESKHCWCYLTQQEFGPDGGKVAPERCTQGRRCYLSPIEEDRV